MADRPYVDDPAIRDDDILWRRVPDWPDFIVKDKSDERIRRVSSAAFDDDVDGDPMSVFVARMTTVEVVLSGHEGFGVVEFTAGFVRRPPLGQVVFLAEVDEQPGHAKVAGRKTSGVRRAFARSARWVRRPPGYDERSLPDPPSTVS